jgi:hypothetical protein
MRKLQGNRREKKNAENNCGNIWLSAKKDVILQRF